MTQLEQYRSDRANLLRNAMIARRVGHGSSLWHYQWRLSQIRKERLK